MTLDTMAVDAPSSEIDTANDTSEVVAPTDPAAETTSPVSTPATAPADEPSVIEPSVIEESAVETPKKAPAKKAAGKRTKTVELTLTVTGTADGDWRAELKHGSTFLARNIAVAAAAVSRAARELHEDLSTPIDEIIEGARSQQAAKVAALEAELEAARKALAELD
jgi:hypothetical protein